VPDARGDSAGSVCFFVRAFEGGGAQRDAILLANGIAASGTAASIVTLDAKGPLRDLVDPGVPIIDLGRGHKLRMALAFPALRTMLKTQRPVVFVASEAAGNALGVAVVGSLPRASRPRLVLREVASPVQARRADPYLQNRIGYWLAPFTYPRADLVVALTEAVRRDLVAHFGVPEAGAARLGTNAVLTAPMLQALAQTARQPEPGLIVAVGRLSPEKGFADLVAAMALLASRPGTRLIIAGEGTERAALDAQIASLGLGGVVQLAGFQSDPLALLRRAALFVSASHHEGLGNAIIEALASGVPVIATDAPHGPREVLADGKWGVLVPVGDPPALAKAIAAALEAPQDGTAGTVRAMDFTVEAAAAAFLKLLREQELLPRV